MIGLLNVGEDCKISLGFIRNYPYLYEVVILTIKAMIEYNTVSSHYNEGLLREVQYAARSGWELVTVIESREGQLTAYLKRLPETITDRFSDPGDKVTLATEEAVDVKTDKFNIGSCDCCDTPLSCKICNEYDLSGDDCCEFLDDAGMLSEDDLADVKSDQDISSQDNVVAIKSSEAADPSILASIHISGKPAKEFCKGEMYRLPEWPRLLVFVLTFIDTIEGIPVLYGDSYLNFPSGKKLFKSDLQASPFLNWQKVS